MSLCRYLNTRRRKFSRNDPSGNSLSHCLHNYSNSLLFWLDGYLPFIVCLLRLFVLWLWLSVHAGKIHHLGFCRPSLSCSNGQSDMFQPYSPEKTFRINVMFLDWDVANHQTLFQSQANERSADSNASHTSYVMSVYK